MSTADMPEPHTFECGCRVESMIVDGVNTMVLTACPSGADCRVVQMTAEETAAQGKPMTVVDAS